MKVCFSPGEACRNAIINEIKNAIQELKICVFTISDDQITQAILDAHRRKVAVTIITDNDKTHDVGSDIGLLSKNGIQVKMDMSTNHMHHKFMIADERTVITGSYNWTNSAARFNQENIIIAKEKEAIKSFVNEYDRLWKIMTDYY
ncbi:MAG: DUF1669 domain-containing protein [Bacteroidetes bacterium]|nr:DUF1669 domain-containing protein [Bacteroidota bacterium]